MAIWERLRWPPLWAAIALCVAKDCVNNRVGIEGKDIVLSPLDTGNLTGISWKKEENLVADSLFHIEMEEQKMSLDSSSGSLFLKNLSQQDSGNYTAQAFINKKIKETCFVLKVLVLPDINCTVNSDTIQLNCTSASQGLSLSYSWDYIRHEEITYVNHQSVIQLRRNSDPFQKITCYVSAFGSNASKSIHLSDCIPEEPDHQSRNRIFILIPIIISAVVVFLCCLKVKNPAKKEVSKTLNESESGAKSIREISELSGEERKSHTESRLELGECGRKREGEDEERYIVAH